MHEHFYVIQLLIEADVIKVPPLNHISNKPEGVGLDNGYVQGNSLICEPVLRPTLLWFVH